MKSAFLIDKSSKDYYSDSFKCYIRSNGEIRMGGEGPNDDEEEFVVEFKFRPLTNAEIREIMSKVLSVKGRQNVDDVDFDVVVYKDMCLKKSLQEWNLTYDNGDPIPINERNIDNLHPVIANAMANIISNKIGNSFNTLS